MFVFNLECSSSPNPSLFPPCSPRSCTPQYRLEKPTFAPRLFTHSSVSWRANGYPREPDTLCEIKLRLFRQDSEIDEQRALRTGPVAIPRARRDQPSARDSVFAFILLSRVPSLSNLSAIQFRAQSVTHQRFLTTAYWYFSNSTELASEHRTIYQILKILTAKLAKMKWDYETDVQVCSNCLCGSHHAHKCCVQVRLTWRHV